MPARTRKKGTSAASNSNPHNPTEDSAPERSNKSTRANVSKRPPQAPRSTNPPKRVRNNTTTNANEASTNNLSTGSEELENESEITPTLNNYTSLMDSWPPGRILERLQENKASTRTRLSTEISNRVKLVHKKFKQELLMLAMIGKVSESTIKSYIPGMSATRAISRYTLFLEYNLDCLTEPMPLKGQDECGPILGDRNTKNGARYRALSEDEKAVFEPQIFYALAGVPNPLVESETEEDILEDNREGQELGSNSLVPIPKVDKLSVEDDELYRPIYERLVDMVKVEKELDKPSAGPSPSQVQRRSKAAFLKIAHQLACESNRLDFAYYLVATSTVTPDKSSELGWLKQYTSHPQIATWANKTCHLATVFATYSQGVSMVKAIASVNQKPKRQRPDKQQPSDKIKVDLGRLLAALTVKTLGFIPPQAFPQTADPVAELKKRGLPISIVFEEGSRLTHEKLQVGFKKMRSATRSEWLEDIKDGHFRLMELGVGSEEAIGEPVALDPTEIEAALTTSPRAMDKAVGSINYNNSEQSDANQAQKNAKKKKHGDESETTSESDEDED